MEEKYEKGKGNKGGIPKMLEIKIKVKWGGRGRSRKKGSLRINIGLFLYWKK
jgi:hypothetical protein